MNPRDPKDALWARTLPKQRRRGELTVASLLRILEEIESAALRREEEQAAEARRERGWPSSVTETSDARPMVGRWFGEPLQRVVIRASPDELAAELNLSNVPMRQLEEQQQRDRGHR